MSRRVSLFLILLLTSLGCAKMEVNKITMEDRCNGEEYDIKGFRYYLSRPYVVVNNKLEIAKSKRLLVIDLCAPENDKWRSLIGKSNQPVPQELYADLGIAAVRTLDAKSPRFESVGEAEWGRIRNAIRTEDPARPSKEIVQTAGPDPQSEPPAILDLAKKQTDAYMPLIGESSLPNLEGTIRVIFLPDLDEQYAVDNVNCLAQSKYALQFRNGWELVSVNGEFDSTEVAIELMDTIQSAITAARTFGVNAIQRRQSALSAADFSESALAFLGTEDLEKVRYLLLEVTETTSIRPGLYRVNKPWETDGCELQGTGLLAQMGLPLVVETTVKIAESETEESIRATQQRNTLPTGDSTGILDK